MCGRFFVGSNFRVKLDILMKASGIAPADPSYREEGQDIVPSNMSAVICRRGEKLAAAKMQWGFANPYRKGLIINARAETARKKKLFSESIEDRRLIIPASGFYEWDPYRARFRFTAPGDDLLLLAGFYHEEQGVPHYTILTTEANESVQPVHDRMPVMIRQDEIRPWIMDKEKLSEFLGRPQFPLLRELDSGQIRMDFGL